MGAEREPGRLRTLLALRDLLRASTSWVEGVSLAMSRRRRQADFLISARPFSAKARGRPLPLRAPQTA